MPKKRKRLYLETSFWKRLGDTKHPERRILSYRFLHRVCSSHKVLISGLAVRELARTPDPEEWRVIAARLAGTRLRTITHTRRARELAETLLVNAGWSRAQYQDMLHISYAILGRADAIVSWDKAHVACERTRKAVNRICKLRGSTPPYLGTPAEVARWLGVAIG